MSSSSGEEESEEESVELPPLHEACQEGSPDEVRRLLEEGGDDVDVNQVIDGNYTALYVVCSAVACVICAFAFVWCFDPFVVCCRRICRGRCGSVSRHGSCRSYFMQRHTPSILCAAVQKSQVHLGVHQQSANCAAAAAAQS